MINFSTIWQQALQQTLASGREVSPRGQRTLEIPQRTIEVAMRYPVLTVPDRKLNYRFMAAEAYWILTGDNRVATIAPWNSRIADFSDDGETFFGAYGPRIAAQLPYVIEKLQSDPDTRQAGLTTWRECPPATKDVPCTVAFFFNIRDGHLNVHVFMRSSDLWLGVPYDVFNFSMLGHLVCAKLNEGRDLATMVRPGQLYLTAASSHLYEVNLPAAEACATALVVPALPTLDAMWQRAEYLLATLAELRDSKPGDPARWWEV